METTQPIDIMTMIEPIEQQRKELMNKTCRYICMAYRAGATKKEAEATIKRLELPIDIHLAVFAHFTEICNHGRILTKAQRLILN